MEVCSQESTLSQHSTPPPSLAVTEFLEDSKAEDDASTDAFICGDVTALKPSSPFGVVPPSPGFMGDSSMPLLDVDLVDKTLQTTKMEMQLGLFDTTSLDSSIISDGLGWEDNFTDLFQFVQ